MTSQPKRAAAPIAPQIDEHDDDDEKPRDIEAIRLEFARRLHINMSNHLKRWRSCRERLCKRTRACCAPHGHCSNIERSKKPATEEQIARVKALIARAFRAHDARLEAAQAAQKTDQSHKKS